jgi:hypothetical protein
MSLWRRVGEGSMEDSEESEDEDTDEDIDESDDEDNNDVEDGIRMLNDWEGEDGDASSMNGSNTGSEPADLSDVYTDKRTPLNGYQLDLNDYSLVDGTGKRTFFESESAVRAYLCAEADKDASNMKDSDADDDDSIENETDEQFLLRLRRTKSPWDQGRDRDYKDQNFFFTDKNSTRTFFEHSWEWNAYRTNKLNAQDCEDEIRLWNDYGMYNGEWGTGNITLREMFQHSWTRAGANGDPDRELSDAEHAARDKEDNKRWSKFEKGNSGSTETIRELFERSWPIAQDRENEDDSSIDDGIMEGNDVEDKDDTSMMDSERGTGSSKVDHGVSVCQCHEYGDNRCCYWCVVP